MIRLCKGVFAAAIAVCAAYSAPALAQCTVPNLITNGQVADASEVMDNFNAVAACADEAAGAAVEHTGTPQTGAIAVFTGPESVTSGDLSGDVGTRTIAYDARGNTASEARPGLVTVTADYDGYGRLIEYDRSNAGAQAYAYNGLDDRVTMVTPTATRHFVYDASGRVLGEYGLSAADVHAEFIWALPELATGAFGGGDGVGSYAPLAVATPDGLGAIQINWVHGNHLGVPLVSIDAAGNLASTPNDYLAPGFPGQSRTFADLYYNRYRDYDPVTGRYIQADPIGLAGGSNRYLYAEANPVNLTDPEGLQYRAPPRPPSSRRGSRTPYQYPRARSASPYRPGETFIGPPGSRPTAAQIAHARGQCPRYGETPWTIYGRQAHQNYRDALGFSYQYNFRLPSGLRPDAVDFARREVRELKPGNPRAIKRGERQLEQYRRELEALTGKPWNSALDLYRPPRR